ncbi:MauE/DoxX family redox-associated membrane protein [Kineobactrum salinum]|uniref:Methylamine utilization protein MauE n=1 Tax=Kineobactrum salinum TaxID=2708301 RepID=A0A6C0TYG5_9GAMM|nr:MauE/DoxX family redox-associated membrane protein [Kineobactrum salinum]QIB64573.1 hypothetical protein G3T16_03320 [Kineobactrum salinum]
MVVPDLVGFGISGFLLWLFATAGLHKLRAPARFGSVISAYFPEHPITRRLVLPLALLELGIAVALVLPVTAAAGLLAAAMVLVLYGALMALQLTRGRRDLRCGCAGPASDLAVSPALVARNAICAGLALLALAPRTTDIAAGLAGMGLALYIAVFLIILYLCTEQLVSNGQQLARGRS